MELTPEEFAGAKERMLELFPALDAMEPVKFTLGNTESLVVTRFNLEDQETISLRAYRFQNTDDGWKLLLQFTSKTLTAQNPEADRKAIEHELATLPAFQLAGVEKKKRPDLPSPTVEGLNGRTGAGFLVTGGETYQFDHAVAYKADSGGTPATVVILTDEQLDPEKVKADVKKVGMWNGFKNNVMISFDSANKPQFLWFWVKKDSTSMSAPGFEVVSQVNGEGGKIVGTAMLDALDGQYGTEFFFEVAFNAEVLTP
jgi:hypothetical protein